jgi:hypothetical protein
MEKKGYHLGGVAANNRLIYQDGSMDEYGNAEFKPMTQIWVLRSRLEKQPTDLAAV